MCDTIVLMPSVTGTGRTIIAKNSDREPAEPQHVERYPAQSYPKGSILQTTNKNIAQAEHTFAVILSRPEWMWGAEMGCNENGVAVANHALFTKAKVAEEGLLGMDLVRLGLERGRNAAETMQIIIDLLEKHGQGGASGYRDKSFRYHNSFLIADATKAFVLETVDRQWAYRHVKDYAALSNRITIAEDYDRLSGGANQYAIDNGWLNSKKGMNFRRTFSDKFYTYFSRSKERVRTSYGFLEKSPGLKPDIPEVIDFMSGHDKSPEKWRPWKSSTRSICMHTSSFLCPHQTTASYIGELAAGDSVHWFSGTSAPCLSTYIPYFFPGTTGENANTKNDDRLWFQFERLHRDVLTDYQVKRKAFITERDKFQTDLIAKAHALVDVSGTGRSQRDRLTNEALTIYKQKLADWIDKAGSVAGQKMPWLYRKAWQTQQLE